MIVIMISWVKKVALILIFATLFIITNCQLSIPDSSAHPQPLLVQDFIFRYRPDELRLDYRLRIDPVIADDVFKVVDKNNDSNLSEDELRQYLNDIIFPHLISRLNNRDLKYEVLSIKSAKRSELKSLENYAEIKLKATNPYIQKKNSVYVKFDYKFFPEDPYGDYYSYDDDIISTAGIERINMDSTEPDGFIEYSTDFIFTQADPKPTEIQTTPTNISLSLTGGSNPNNNILKDMQNLSTSLTKRVKESDFNNPFVFITAFLLLFAAGALHALTPGHGKSMVAAFLIGKRKSKLIDVLILGISITLAHTLIIYIIGFLLLLLRQTSNAQNIVLAIEKLSAWLFLGLGVILVYNAYKTYKHYQAHQKGHHHHHDEQSHEHDHKHHWEDQKLNIWNRWDLFYAGISGGIVPCFDALSILFVFNSLGRVDLGIIMVFIFSLGLAAAIILLGVSLLYGKDKLKLEEKIGPKAEYILPFISGGIIALFGVFYILTK